MSGAAPTPARRCAYRVLRRTFEEGAFTDRALDAELGSHGLDARERAFARALAFGAVQRRATLDHLIEALSGRAPAQLDPPLVAALRLGLLQIGFLEGVPAHAAVGESVELAKRAGGRRAHGLVNAVLRRAAHEARGLLEALRDDTADAAALKHSHPSWLARMWWEELGPDAARALMAADNEAAETALRVNTLVSDVASVSARLEAEAVQVRPAEHVADGLVLDSPWNARASGLWRAGAILPQARASMLVAHVVAPQPGERVLDLCAAPGAKATHLAALMGNSGQVVAVEHRPQRARELSDLCRRLRATIVDVREADARDDHGGGYDRVLVDPPCSGLGTLRSRPDLRWRADPKVIIELAELQAEMLEAGARALRPGGVLVYSTCTLSRAENEDRVAAFITRRPEMIVEDLGSDYPLWKHPRVAEHLLTLPHRHATDGFFVARLRKRGGHG